MFEKKCSFGTCITVSTTKSFHFFSFLHFFTNSLERQVFFYLYLFCCCSCLLLMLLPDARSENWCSSGVQAELISDRKICNSEIDPKKVQARRDNENLKKKQVRGTAMINWYTWGLDCYAWQSETRPDTESERVPCVLKLRGESSKEGQKYLPALPPSQYRAAAK